MLHPHQQRMRCGLVALHPHQHLVSTVFVCLFYFSNSNRCGVVSHYASTFMYVTLMANDVEHRSMCSFAIYMSCLVKHLYKSYPFSNWVVGFLTVEFRIVFIYFGYKSFVKYVMCTYFIPVWGISFYFLTRVFWRAKFLIFVKSSLSLVSFMDHAFDIMAEISVSKKTLPNPRSQKPQVILSSWSIKSWASLGSFRMQISTMGSKEAPSPLVHYNKQRVRAS